MLYSATLWRNRNRSVLCLLPFLPYWFYFCFLGLLLTWGMAFIIKSVMTPIVSALIIGLLVCMYSTRARNKFPFPVILAYLSASRRRENSLDNLSQFFSWSIQTQFSRSCLYNMNFQNFDVYFLHLDWNHLFDFSIIKIRQSHMFFCWSFLFPERPIPDEINPLSRTQVP